jgi:hypothetical protein
MIRSPDELLPVLDFCYDALKRRACIRRISVDNMEGKGALSCVPDSLFARCIHLLQVELLKQNLSSSACIAGLSRCVFTIFP